MENYFVNRFKRILKELNDAVMNCKAREDYNYSMYAKQVAESYNEKIEAEINDAVQKARKKAYDTMMRISVNMNQWATVNGKAITKDAELFNGSYPLDVTELQKLADAYKGNYTMLSLINKYCTTNGINGVFYYSAEQRLNAYEKFYNGLLSAIQRCAFNKGCNADEYANPEFCATLYETVGTGEELNDYNMRRLEVQTPMRNYSSPCDDNFNISFNPLVRH